MSSAGLASSICSNNTGFVQSHFIRPHFIQRCFTVTWMRCHRNLYQPVVKVVSLYVFLFKVAEPIDVKGGLNCIMNS